MLKQQRRRCSCDVRLKRRAFMVKQSCFRREDYLVDCDLVFGDNKRRPGRRRSSVSLEKTKPSWCVLGTPGGPEELPHPPHVGSRVSPLCLCSSKWLPCLKDEPRVSSHKPAANNTVYHLCLHQHTTESHETKSVTVRLLTRHTQTPGSCHDMTGSDF